MSERSLDSKLIEIARAMQPLQVLPRSAADTGTQLIPNFAAWYIADILRNAPRAVGFTQNGLHGDIAFKTGTSYGYRDAWALGFTADFTVGVWLGRPDGGSCTGCAGIEVAAPLLPAVFDLIPDTGGPALPVPPDNALLLRTAELPASLRRLDRDTASEGPQPAFPLDGSTLRIAWEDEEPETLPLRADGGQQPYLWLVNGMPVEADRRGEADWSPDGAGFVTVSVTDALGYSAGADVFVEPVGRDQPPP